MNKNTSANGKFLICPNSLVWPPAVELETNSGISLFCDPFSKSMTSKSRKFVGTFARLAEIPRRILVGFEIDRFEIGANTREIPEQINNKRELS